MKKYLSTKQLRAIGLLLEGGTIEYLQDRLKLRASTILRWREQPEFMARLEGCKRALAEDMEYKKERDMQLFACQTLHALQKELFGDFADMNLVKTSLDVLKQVAKTPKRLEMVENDQKQSKTVKNARVTAENSPPAD